jgi:hypothetical protein
MLFRKPWLRDVKVAHDWGSNIVTIQGDRIVKTITVTKHLGGEVRKLEMLLCYNYQNGITDEEEDIIFIIKLKLFPIKTISLPETIQFVKTMDMEIMDIDVKTSISEQGSRVQSTKKKILNNRYESEVVVKEKLYLETYYKLKPRSVGVDDNSNKNQSIRIAYSKYQRLMKFNLGTDAKPQMVNINA